MNRQQRRAAAKQSGKSTAAELFQASVEHFRSGKIAEAEHCCRQALALDAQHADALHLMGVLCLQAQQNDAAAEWIVRAIRQAPKAAYFSNLGAVLLRQNQLEQAAQAYEKALNLNPQDAVYWKNLGAVLWQLKRTEEAVRHFRRALKLNPQYLEAANSCGSLLFDLGQYAEAVECFNTCEKLNPNAALYQTRGLCLQEMRRYEEAQADYERSIALDPGLAETHNYFGTLHFDLGRMEQALASFDRALQLRPDFSGALTNKALTLVDLQLLDEAFALYHKSLAANPDNPHTIWNLALLQLLTGDFERGWLGREARWKIPPGHFVHRGFSQPLWLGDRPVAGKTILLHSDEGFGDSIQFARYVPMVAALGAQVILEVEPVLQRLMAGLPGVTTCIGRSPATSSLAFDLHCPLGSLPLAFGTRLDTIPSAVPYLPVPAAERVKAWEDRLGPHNRFRVGLVWSGRPFPPNRAIALRTLAPLLDCDAQFISLQKDVRDTDKAFLGERSDIVDLTDQLTDFSDTAALIACLDLVISIDTGVAHLAGAFGIPVWTMLRFNPDYRWLLNRDDSPWYPSMRLFRQPTRGDWTGVVERVRNELESLVAAWRPGREPASLLSVEPVKTTPAELCQAGFEHLQSGRIAEAEHCCRQALALDAQHADAFHLMGVLCLQLQQHHAAAEWIERAIKQEPKAEYFSSLGRVLQRQNRLEEARQAYEEALTHNPQDAVLWKNLGDVLVQLGRTEGAVRHFQQALKLNPQYLEAANNCGVLLFNLGWYAEALECLNISVKLNPDNAALYQMRGVCLQQVGRLEEAQADYEKSVALKPNDAEAHSNLGSLLAKLGQTEQALASFDRALELRPDLSGALTNKALALCDLQLLDEAFALYHKSLAIDPDNATTAWNLALLQLQTGDFERGWLGREARWKIPHGYFVNRDRGFSQPIWLGDQPIAGKTILLHYEEGLGDSIQYARYVPMVAALGAQVILEVAPPLKRLMAGLPGVTTCIGRSSATSSLAFDLHCPLGSLPLAFGTRLNTIPSAVPYLPVPAAERVKAWEGRLGPRNRVRVGLVWSGHAAPNPNRSMALRALAPLLDCDAQFISLQKEVRDSDKAFLAERSGIVDMAEDLTDFSETAALISCLDLVISIDTSVVHLAGALGAPVWTLLLFNPDFRWLLDRDDSPWYPSMRLFRQSKRGDWAGVVERVRLELESLVAAWRPGQGSRPAEPTSAELCQAGFEHLQLGRIAEAEHCCRQALALDAQHADALHLMGVLCLQAQRYDAAAEWIVRAIKQAAKADYFRSLGTLLQRQNRLEQARQAYEKALTLKPQEAVHWKNLASVLIQLGRTEDAVRHLQQALKLDPRYEGAANNCGILLFDLGRYAEAVECFDIWEKINPDNAALYQMRGLCLQRMDRFEEAQADFQRSIGLDPGQAETHKNLGSLHLRLGRIGQALACIDRSLELRPDFPAALNEKARAFWDLGRIDEAFALYHRSLAIDPDNATTTWNLALLQLQTGDFERGWLGREVRWRLPPGLFIHRGFSQPLWLGDRSIAGKTILLHYEEGFGDTIQFVRYAPMVAALGANVILEAEPQFQRLLAGMSGVTKCIDRSSVTSLAFDLHCPLGSLPLAFGTRLDTIPSAVPYLPAPAAERVKAWEDRLGPRKRLRVGLVWSGRPFPPRRAIALRTLAPLLECDAQFISLQKDVWDSDRTFLGERSDIVDLTEHLTDFSDTAALIACVDLVISIDTSVVHLAGALGAPVWAMLHSNPDYRWLLNRDDTPWYPSMRLFRQPKRGDWDSVVERVRLELGGLVAAWRSKAPPNTGN